MINDIFDFQDCYSYTLKTINWKETSLIAHIFSKDYGIIDVMAKGAKKPYSLVRPIIFIFQPLSLSWKGKGDIKILTKANSEGINNLSGNSFIVAWYINELIINFLPKQDPHPVIFETYHKTLIKLSLHIEPIWVTLCYFEWIFLREIGYGLDIDYPNDFNNLKKLKIQLNKHIETHLCGKKLKTKKILTDLLKLYNKKQK
ncbi:DNA repair protein RecO [Candidatus Kinetoplastibacterium sorsogonicusi]|uniref:DNA repair protein RecO n=1 Tax=Candidatus Kinetoplastidibacterium kentomonadis TaxID=1576550 RepID=A0A3Q8EUB2_9PROT|nr:DNA repair protein RecO [Candidatus Kinetoplastibacterium sorsogonicusi]AWD32550.1 DNA repair protein RecO [Candidatus Kinetoplastibacterium sorsogonicusi]